MRLFATPNRRVCDTHAVSRATYQRGRFNLSLRWREQQGPVTVRCCSPPARIHSIGPPEHSGNPRASAQASAGNFVARQRRGGGYVQ